MRLGFGRSLIPLRLFAPHAMPDSVVVDASALAAAYFGEPEGAEVAEHLDTVTLHAPALLYFEMANVCAIKIRRAPDQRSLFMAGHAAFEHLPIRIISVQHPATIDLADQAGLSAYDASYLWLAKNLGVGLVTLDDRLAKAARAVGVTTPQ